MKPVKFSFNQTDQMILNSYKSMLEGLADYLGNGYEFVLHSLENLNESVIKIINGAHSGRTEGAPITDLALSMLSKIEEEGNHEYISYPSKNKKGEPLKASTIIIRGTNNKVIGLLCINFYLNTPFINVLEGFSPINNSVTTYVAESFVENADDLIKQMVEQAKAEIATDYSISPSLKNKKIIAILYEQGVFKLKNSVIKIAEILDISKNTVYMHIRTLKGNVKI
jgi:predicted transcriptional regulator YheO